MKKCKGIFARLTEDDVVCYKSIDELSKEEFQEFIKEVNKRLFPLKNVMKV